MQCVLCGKKDCSGYVTNQGFKCVRCANQTDEILRRNFATRFDTANERQETILDIRERENARH